MLLALTLAGARAEEPISDAQRQHWAFRSPVGDPARSIDQLVGAKRAEAGRAFAPEADRRTLIRRVTFGLTGLPPTPEAVAAFLADSSPGAFARVVDRLLASPAYGERWAQHWLDVARFAESDGFEHDKVRPEAWRYRDWVIDALNADMPYDRFVQLQLAADEIAPDDAAAQAATGFLMAGPDMADINLSEERRHTFLNAMTATVGESLLGLTLGCAQCHDHKTDPVSIDDFYRMRAIFANTVVGPQRDKPLGTTVRESQSTAPESFVRLRGDFRSEGAKVGPAFLRVLNPQGATIAPPDAGAPTSMRRTAFARWLTRPDHPLTARVIVNRLWQHHFGSGIVVTSGDFGATGEPPAHPELLDWLATELPRQGWSLKAMHRLIVTSRSYRQAAATAGSPLVPMRRRLDGEEIRDSFLAISGQLNPDGGGPGVRPPLPKEVTSTLLKKQWDVTPDEAGHRRRSIYLFVRRNLRYPIFDAFDRPDSNASCSRRSHSTTAPQSLMLLNSEFSLAAAEDLALRLSREASEPDQKIDLAYALLFARPPDDEERALGLRFLAESELTDYCLALLNTNEMIYVD